MRRVVETSKNTDIAKLIERVQRVGEQLNAAQPKELTIGNITRRVLGVIREESEEDRDGEANEHRNGAPDSWSQKAGTTNLQPSSTPTSSNGTVPAPIVTSMFSLLSHPISNAISDSATPSSRSLEGRSISSTQAAANSEAVKDFKAEVIEGIQEILDEVSQADDQIAGYSLDHIHSNEIILTHSSSMTTQRFLLKASGKRKFTVIHAEAYPNDHEATHTAVIGRGKTEPGDHVGPELFTKTLTAAGITVIVIPDNAVFALMSRVNKVLLSAHAVLANGDFVAGAGSKAIAQAARLHRTHVVVLSAVYQLSPVYPFDPEALMEDGDPSLVVNNEDGDVIDNIEVQNPLFDYVTADLTDLYITNL